MLEAHTATSKSPSPKYIPPIGLSLTALYRKGVLSEDVKNNMLYLENTLLEFSKSLVILANNNSRPRAYRRRRRAVTDYPDILNCLERMPSIEQERLTYLQKRAKESLARILQHFGDNHILYTRQQALENELFGKKPYHEDLAGFLGDYIAVAKSPLTIFKNENQMNALKGIHAGATLKEKSVPLIAVDCL